MSQTKMNEGRSFRLEFPQQPDAEAAGVYGAAVPSLLPTVSELSTDSLMLNEKKTVDFNQESGVLSFSYLHEFN